MDTGMRAEIKLVERAFLLGAVYFWRVLGIPIVSAILVIRLSIKSNNNEICAKTFREENIVIPGCIFSHTLSRSKQPWNFTFHSFRSR